VFFQTYYIYYFENFANLLGHFFLGVHYSLQICTIHRPSPSTGHAYTTQAVYGVVL